MKIVPINWDVLVNNPGKAQAISRGGRLVSRIQVLTSYSPTVPATLRVTFIDGHVSELKVEKWGWAAESGYKNDVIQMMVEDSVLEQAESVPELPTTKRVLRNLSRLTTGSSRLN